MLQYRLNLPNDTSNIQPGKSSLLSAGLLGYDIHGVVAGIVGKCWGPHDRVAT